MEQHEERTASARHPEGREGERVRGYVARPATLSSAPQAPPPHQLLLSLQQSAGNRAVRGLIQRLRQEAGQARSPQAALTSGRRLIQRALWQNEPADFQTDNETRGEIPNSEYSVKETSYERYAPINEIRLPGQVYLKGSRSFAYIAGGEEEQQAAFATKSATRSGDKIVLNTGAQKIEALLKPKTGLAVWDSQLDPDGKVTNPLDVHVGHGVYNVGKDHLPTLTKNREKLAEIEKGEESVRAAQAAYSLWEDLTDLMNDIMHDQGISMAKALAKMKNDPDIGPLIEQARRRDPAVKFDIPKPRERDERLDLLADAKQRARERLLPEPAALKPAEDTGQTVEELLGMPQLTTEHGRDQQADDAPADGEPATPEGALPDLSWVDEVLGSLDAGESPESKASDT